ncbi:MAG: helicase associated domain-containing protein, partial [Fluviibacter sp.]
SFAALKSFYIREGHFRIARGVLENGVDLGGWVIKQRTRRNHLTQEQISQLDSIDFSWNPIEEEWDKHFNVLLRFWKKEGHCRVTQKQEVDSLSLGTWVQKQRAKKDQLSTSQRDRLNSLGFSWDPIAEQWEEAFAALRKFRKREGHCRVPRSHLEDGVNLGGWVTKQRQKKAKLTPDRIKRLSKLNFLWKIR